MPKVLLLTGVPPGQVGVGSIYLRDLCMLYPHDRICCFHTNPLAEGRRSPELSWLPMEYAHVPQESGEYGPMLVRLSQCLSWSGQDLLVIPRVARQAVRFARSQGVDLVWATLHTPTTIKIARRVAECLNVPLVTTVWDPPEYVLADCYQQDRITRARALDRFDSCMKSAVRCGAASNEMKERYERQFGTSCIVMNFPQRRLRQSVPASSRPRDDRFVIGYAGTIYAPETWIALLQALASCQWSIGGRRVVIRVLTYQFQLPTSHPVEIEMLGWRGPAETQKALSEADVAYIPYWFGVTYREAVELSFPSKICSYVAARVPLLYHGPERSSPSEFLKRFPIGVGCHSLDATAIIHCLERIATDAEFVRRAREACDDAYHAELNADVFRSRFAQLLGVATEDLLPLPESHD